MNHIFCIHSLVEGHLGSFHFLALTNKAAMNIEQSVSCGMVGHVLGIRPEVVDLCL